MVAISMNPRVLTPQERQTLRRLRLEDDTTLRCDSGQLWGFDMGGNRYGIAPSRIFDHIEALERQLAVATQRADAAQRVVSALWGDLASPVPEPLRPLPTVCAALQWAVARGPAAGEEDPAAVAVVLSEAQQWAQAMLTALREYWQVEATVSEGPAGREGHAISAICVQPTATTAEGTSIDQAATDFVCLVDAVSTATDDHNVLRLHSASGEATRQAFRRLSESLRAARASAPPDGGAQVSPRGFDLDAFSAENRTRCEAPDGFNHPLQAWSLSDWMTAALGELGEAANIAKKLNRVRDGIRGNTESEAELRERFGNEVADTLIYLDLLVQSQGLRLAEIVRQTFDAKSATIGYRSPAAVATGGHSDGE